MRDMTTIQGALVAAHIADLQREAAALRAERERDRVRARAAAGTDQDHVAVLPSRRVRIGHRLMAFGEAVAGSARPSGGKPRSLTATPTGTDDPCGDGQDRLAPAT
jgi:hypothetical protein